MKKLQFGILLFGLCFFSSLGWSDTLKLRNGSTINGTYAGGSEDQISFRVGSSVQQYNVSDIASLAFDSYNGSRDSDASSRNRDDSGFSARRDRDDAPPPRDDQPPQRSDDSTYRHFSNNITVPSGTRIVVRTIDPVDSDKNQVGDKFKASLEEALYVNDVMVAPKGTDVYGRLEQVKQAGQMTGRSELKLALTGMMVNGQTVALSTSDYDLAGKSRGANTAKKVGGGAAVGAIIGAIAGGGKGAAIGAGVGAGAGGAVQVLTHGEQVHVPSETLLEFTLDQPITVARAQ